MATKAAEYNPNDPPKRLLEAFMRNLDECVGAGATFAERERAGLVLANALCRGDQRQELTRRSERLSTPTVRVGDTHYRKHSTGTVKYHGLCGPLWVERAVYREIGVHNGRTLVPLEFDAGLMQRATPILAFALVQGHAQTNSWELTKLFSLAQRQPPSRSTMERVAQGLGEAMHEALSEIEPVVRASEQVPAAARAVVLGLDRTSVPMREAREDGTTQPRRRRTKPHERTPPAPYDVNYRMAYVGTISVVDEDGEALCTRRYGVGAHGDPDSLVARMMADLEAAHAQKPDLLVAVLQDGAPEMWNVMRRGLASLPTVEAVGGAFEAIDKHHLLERLSDCLVVVGRTPAYREQKRREWNEALDHEPDAIDVIEQEIIALHESHRGAARRKLYEHRTYLENNKDRMRYAELTSRGLPVGSGITEGACKSLVQIRAKSCGQRWSNQGVDNLLLLRGLHMSDRLPECFELLAQRHQAVVIRAA